MQRVSTLIQKQEPEHGLPVRGVNGYAGEQDGDRALFSDLFHFRSRAKADEAFPNGLPDYVQLHWARYKSGQGWEVVFGWWQSQDDDTNPLIAYC